MQVQPPLVRGDKAEEEVKRHGEEAVDEELVVKLRTGLPTLLSRTMGVLKSTEIKGTQPISANLTRELQAALHIPRKCLHTTTTFRKRAGRATANTASTRTRMACASWPATCAS